MIHTGTYIYILDQFKVEYFKIVLFFIHRFTRSRERLQTNDLKKNDLCLLIILLSSLKELSLLQYVTKSLASSHMVTKVILV